MLGGAHRPRPVNQLDLACRLLNQVIRIDKRLRPSMQEQERRYKQWLWEQSWEPLLRKVYGEAAEQAGCYT
jgi:hypothetical protein